MQADSRRILRGTCNRAGLKRASREGGSAIALGEALGAPSEMRYLRGFIADLADTLECEAPEGATAMWPPPRDAMLRNC